ncbi:bicaudal-D-related protein 2-like [Aulostomus maculatus]
MDYSQPFSVLNEKLRPRTNASEQLYNSLSRLNRKTHRPSVLPTEPKVSLTEPEDPEEHEEDEMMDSASDSLEEGSCSDALSFNSCLISELSFKDEEDDSSSCQSEEKDNSGYLTSEGTGDSSESGGLPGEDGNSSKRSYVDRILPDLLNSGRGLSRRRTLGHVSDTLKEVRREVELSRRRSIRLKAQVDKLQESREGPGWSQHRERVTEEVLSILRLLRPLMEQTESSSSELDREENRLDGALAQLQNVSRKLAINLTQKVKPGQGSGAEDSALLQQALRDRDEAIEKKKAMEAELLRSKTELMMLNNQLLEAAQKRLELSLELEAWKEDMQLILQQQVQMQQQAEQAQKKPTRMGLLRRTNKLPIQRPSNFPLPAPTSPTTNTNQIVITRAAVPPSPNPNPSSSADKRNWKEKLRRVKVGRQGDHDADSKLEWRRENDGFQVISLD